MKQCAHTALRELLRKLEANSARWPKFSILKLTPFLTYHAAMGRWLNRDPIGEIGGVNIFAFSKNRPISLFDGFGLVASDDEKIINLAKVGAAEALARTMKPVMNWKPHNPPSALDVAIGPNRNALSEWYGCVCCLTGDDGKNTFKILEYFEGGSRFSFPIVPAQRCRLKKGVPKAYFHSHPVGRIGADDIKAAWGPKSAFYGVPSFVGQFLDWKRPGDDRRKGFIIPLEYTSDVIKVEP